MRVWNCRAVQDAAPWGFVLELPMRVWNPHSLCKLKNSLCSFGVTYEGLKPIPHTTRRTRVKQFWSYLWGFETRNEKTRRWPHPSRFWSYLWGFETAVFHYCTTLPVIVLELPMRVWNFKVEAVDVERHRGFGVTYEGLKHFIFQKHQCVVSVSFGVTYEGLKLHHLDLRLSRRVAVLELPMRVWNSW